MKYKIKTASLNEILFHLQKCDESFVPPLSQRVNLDEFSKKIVDNAITFEAWKGNRLIGLVSAYLNDTKNLSCFINNVSVENNFNNKGIASSLLNMCINYASEYGFAQIVLWVSSNNTIALHLYQKFEFFQNPISDNTISMIKTLKRIPNGKRL